MSSNEKLIETLIEQNRALKALVDVHVGNQSKPNSLCIDATSAATRLGISLDTFNKEVKEGYISIVFIDPHRRRMFDIGSIDKLGQMRSGVIPRRKARDEMTVGELMEREQRPATGDNAA